MPNSSKYLRKTLIILMATAMCVVASFMIAACGSSKSSTQSSSSAKQSSDIVVSDFTLVFKGPEEGYYFPVASFSITNNTNKEFSLPVLYINLPAADSSKTLDFEAAFTLDEPLAPGATVTVSNDMTYGMTEEQFKNTEEIDDAWLYSPGDRVPVKGIPTNESSKEIVAKAIAELQPYDS